MTQQQKITRTPVTIVCREAGLDCDFEVADTAENEVLLAAQAHVKRVHGADYTFEQLRPLVRKVKS